MQKELVKADTIGIEFFNGKGDEINLIKLFLND